MRKNIKKLAFFIMLAVGISLSFPVCLFAYEQKRAYSSRKLVIRQETYSANGISICRPVPLDMEIWDFINKNNIRSIEDYVDWVQKNIRYEKDKGKDTWAAPQVTLKRKYGDCEDYAFLNAAVLRVLGYQPKVLAMKGLTGGHAICVFQENGYYFWIDNTEIKKTSTRTIVDFGRYLHDEYGSNRLLVLKQEVESQTSVSNSSFGF